MSSKNEEKNAARDVQALTGRSYQSSLNLVREWKKNGLVVWDEVKKLAARSNELEDMEDGS